MVRFRKIWSNLCWPLSLWNNTYHLQVPHFYINNTHRAYVFHLFSFVGFTSIFVNKSFEISYQLNIIIISSYYYYNIFTNVISIIYALPRTLTLFYNIIQKYIFKKHYQFYCFDLSINDISLFQMNEILDST